MRIYKSIYYKDIHAVGVKSWLMMYLPLLFFDVLCPLFGSIYISRLCLGLIIAMECPLSSLWADDNQGYTKYSPSLMIPRSTVVNSKFLELMGRAFLAVILTELSLAAGCLIRGEKLYYLNSLFVLSTAFQFVSLISAAIMLMFMGHKLIAMALICGGAGMFGGLYGGVYDDLYFTAQEWVISENSDAGFLLSTNYHLITIAVCAAVTGVIWVLTLFLYGKRDL